MSTETPDDAGDVDALAVSDDAGADAQGSDTGSVQEADAMAPDAALPAFVEVTPADYDFGDVAVGTDSPRIKFTVTNTGGSPAGRQYVSLAGGDQGHFLIVGDNCATMETLAPKHTCVVYVKFHPADVGASMTTVGPIGTSATRTVATLKGMGVAP